MLSKGDRQAEFDLLWEQVYPMCERMTARAIAAGWSIPPDPARVTYMGHLDGGQYPVIVGRRHELLRGAMPPTPELEEELKECLFCLKRNEMMFDLEVDTDLIEQRIYERQALLCRYRYLLARARELGLHTVLTKYQPQI